MVGGCKQAKVTRVHVSVVSCSVCLRQLWHQAGFSFEMDLKLVYMEIIVGGFDPVVLFPKSGSCPTIPQVDKKMRISHEMR